MCPCEDLTDGNTVSEASISLRQLEHGSLEAISKVLLWIKAVVHRYLDVMLGGGIECLIYHLLWRVNNGDVRPLVKLALAAR